MSASRRGLQLAVAVFGCVPVFAGLAGGLTGSHMLGETVPADLDSHVRYLSGLLLAIGLVFWWQIPRIEQAGPLFRVLTLIVFVGGVCRLLGGVQPGPMGWALVMELAVTPLLCFWQKQVSSSFLKERTKELHL